MRGGLDYPRLRCIVGKKAASLVVELPSIGLLFYLNKCGTITVMFGPTPFHHPRTVVLRKPQKPTYNIAKAYRPIALLNMLGKVLEKIVARCISALVEEHGLLPTTQMGVRPGRSPITTLEMLTEQIRTVWAKDHTLVASMLSLDISGAFDNVSHDRLVHNIRDARLPPQVAEYIRSFLTNRTTTLTLGTFKDRIRSTTSGIP
jgi:hypothetical protein